MIATIPQEFRDRFARGNANFEHATIKYYLALTTKNDSNVSLFDVSTGEPVYASNALEYWYMVGETGYDAFQEFKIVTTDVVPYPKDGHPLVATATGGGTSFDIEKSSTSFDINLQSVDIDLSAYTSIIADGYVIYCRVHDTVGNANNFILYTMKFDEVVSPKSIKFTNNIVAVI